MKGNMQTVQGWIQKIQVSRFRKVLENSSFRRFSALHRLCAHSKRNSLKTIILTDVYGQCGCCASLMVSAQDSVASAWGSSPGQGCCVVFLILKTLYSHSASLHPGV